MATKARQIGVASDLMQMALALLDEASELLPAARLQHALDSLQAGHQLPVQTDDIEHPQPELS